MWRQYTNEELKFNIQNSTNRTPSYAMFPILDVNVKIKTNRYHTFYADTKCHR